MTSKFGTEVYLGKASSVPSFVVLALEEHCFRMGWIPPPPNNKEPAKAR